MAKHITVWCQPRSGSSAYCNYLKTTGQVKSDLAQEIMSMHSSWPSICKEEKPVNPNTNNAQYRAPHQFDNDFKWKCDNKPNNIKHHLDNHNDEWVWSDWKSTEKGIIPFYTRTIPMWYIKNHLDGMTNLLKVAKIPEAIKLYEWDVKRNPIIPFEDIKYDTGHHILIRDPLDNALSEIIAQLTMVYHKPSTDETATPISEYNISFNPNIEREKYHFTPYQWVHRCCEININLLETLGDKVNKIVKYEDIDFTGNKFKKIHTKAEKIAVSKDMEHIEDMLNNYQKRLDSLL
tara:strand:- start:14553 stop:15425 length:873 start_codon:yes stop_codon:yes gene_type:complete